MSEEHYDDEMNDQYKEITKDINSSSNNSNNNLPTNQFPKNIERMFEAFHQSPHGDFRPTFYNPFEVKHRRRTTKTQYKLLERVFQEINNPPASLRRQLAARIGMTPRSVQVWFQNRRAKLKSQQSRGNQQQVVPRLSRSTSSSDLSLQTTVSPDCSEHPSPALTLSDGEVTLRENGRGGGGGREGEEGGRKDMEIPVEDEKEQQSMRPRSNSCPLVMQSIDGTLPFKPLQDALFGGYCHSQQRQSQILSMQASLSHSQGTFKTFRSQSIPNGTVHSMFPFVTATTASLLPASHHPTFSISPPLLEPILEESRGVSPCTAFPNVHPLCYSATAPSLIPPLLSSKGMSLQQQQQQQQQPSHLQHDPAEFDYLLQSTFGDQWLYYPAPPMTAKNNIGLEGKISNNSSSSNRVKGSVNVSSLPPDAFLMSFAEGASFEE